MYCTPIASLDATMAVPVAALVVHDNRTRRAVVAVGPPIPDAAIEYDEPGPVVVADLQAIFTDEDFERMRAYSRTLPDESS